MSLEDFMAPITDACRTHFVTATTAARHMTAQGSGVIVLLSSTASQESRHQMSGFNLACACIEALTRSLAGEVGRPGGAGRGAPAELHPRDRSRHLR
jgi:3-oxoacyl-[acyl-carrier protein] reductase